MCFVLFCFASFDWKWLDPNKILLFCGAVKKTCIRLQFECCSVVSRRLFLLTVFQKTGFTGSLGARPCTWHCYPIKCTLTLPLKLLIKKYDSFHTRGCHSCHTKLVWNICEDGNEKSKLTTAQPKIGSCLHRFWIRRTRQDSCLVTSWFSLEAWQQIFLNMFLRHFSYWLMIVSGSTSEIKQYVLSAH